ncbi:KleE stable inheritance protein [Xenorhabdus bovienii]|uniref:KleE stable inheritance protein n=1 Tax=Xenorhabdus bovienii TaxID=40576 RepID=UPI003DA2D5B7
MSNIYKFPASEKVIRNKSMNTFSAPQKWVNTAIKAIWLLMAICWPILRWILAVDVAFQFSRMLWNWNTQGSYAGWTFLLHFVLFTALTFFMTNFKSKKL